MGKQKQKVVNEIIKDAQAYPWPLLNSREPVIIRFFRKFLDENPNIYLEIQKIFNKKYKKNLLVYEYTDEYKKILITFFQEYDFDYEYTNVVRSWHTFGKKFGTPGMDSDVLSLSFKRTSRKRTSRKRTSRKRPSRKRPSRKRTSRKRTSPK